MKTRFTHLGLGAALVVALLASTGVAAAHCGFCGTGDDKDKKDKKAMKEHKHDKGAKSAEVGNPAPDFTLEDIDGDKHSLSDFEGKIVVLEWFNPGCPFVKKYYSSGAMQKLQKSYTDQGVVWLTINSSAKGKQGYSKPDEYKDVVKEHNFNSTAAFQDADGKVGKLYGAKTTPHMFVIDKDGTLVYDGAIDSVATPNPKDIGGATNYVAQAIDELEAGKPVSVPTSKPYGCSVKY